MRDSWLVILILGGVVALLLSGSCESEDIKQCGYACHPSKMQSYSKANGCVCVTPEVDAGK